MTELYSVEGMNPNEIRAVKTGEKRTPKKGEYYVSGAIPMAYEVPNDLDMVFNIVKLVRVKRIVGFEVLGDY